MKPMFRRPTAGSASLALALLVLFGPSALTASAHAASHKRARQAKHGAHASKGEKHVEGSLDYELSPAGSSLPATQTITLFLPGGVRVAGASMPKCNPQALEKSGPAACPKGSSIGSGTATGWTLGQLWPLTLTLYNGPGGSLLSYVTATSPVKIETVVEGHVTSPGNPYGEEIANTIPQGLLEPLPGDTAQTVNLRVQVSGRSGWLRSTNCAPHALAVNFKFSYTNGQTIAIGGNLNCV
ncbi:MAG TPA: hypothetical protein VMB05_13635 [Solirubrobacteraceae bacterium]|nr:hypothetical protein [Solirubrobacteraceae bacterium]